MAVRERARPLVIGLETARPVLARQPGALASAKNYEVDFNGYRRIDGFERYDGRPRPSDALYFRIPYKNLTSDITNGEILTVPFGGSDTSVLALDNISYSSNPSGYINVGYLQHVPDDGNVPYPDSYGQIKRSGVSIADISGASSKNAGSSSSEILSLKKAVSDYLRSQIQPLPGSGPVLLAAPINGYVIAARSDGANPPSALLFKATQSGWSQIQVGKVLDFSSGGTYQIKKGDTITGATSGATAYVDEVILESGSWSSGNAAGYLVISSQNGAFQSEDLNVGSNSNVATIAGDSSDIKISASGPFFWAVGSLSGGTNESLFFTDGSGLFEFDGSIILPLPVSASSPPRHVAVHSNHLFVSTGHTVNHSGIGNSRDWRAVSGASEIAVGSPITGMVTFAQSLIILSEGRVHVLSGTSSADWSLRPLSMSSGAFEKTVNIIGQPVFLDRGGIRVLETTATFGDFQIGTISQHVTDIVDQFVSLRSSIVGAIVSEKRSAYRIMLNDGRAISVFVGRNPAGFSLLEYGKKFSFAWSGESIGSRWILCGGEDGYVYEMDRGPSFDGYPIFAMIYTVADHLESRNMVKRFLRLMIEVDAEYANLKVAARYDYQSHPAARSDDIDFATVGQGATWGSFVWGDALWGLPEMSPLSFHITGRGFAIALYVESQSDIDAPHTLQSYVVRYSDRRAVP